MGGPLVRQDHSAAEKKGENGNKNPPDYYVLVSFLDAFFPVLSPVLASLMVCSILFGMVEIAACF